MRGKRPKGAGKYVKGPGKGTRMRGVHKTARGQERMKKLAEKKKATAPHVRHADESAAERRRRIAREIARQTGGG